MQATTTIQERLTGADAVALVNEWLPANPGHNRQALARPLCEALNLKDWVSSDLVNREGAVSEERPTDMPKTRPAYTEEFRQQAVQLLLDSGRPLDRVAGDDCQTGARRAGWCPKCRRP
ncbi:MAG: transposase [Verrucomicrobiales bacterium]|nr:transposase [Verrucomicrobiales bacterium]